MNFFIIFYESKKIDVILIDNLLLLLLFLYKITSYNVRMQSEYNYIVELYKVNSCMEKDFTNRR